MWETSVIFPHPQFWFSLGCCRHLKNDPNVRSCLYVSLSLLSFKIKNESWRHWMIWSLWISPHPHCTPVTLFCFHFCDGISSTSSSGSLVLLFSSGIAFPQSSPGRFLLCFLREVSWKYSSFPTSVGSPINLCLCLKSQQALFRVGNYVLTL